MTIEEGIILATVIAILLVALILFFGYRRASRVGIKDNGAAGTIGAMTDQPTKERLQKLVDHLEDQHRPPN